MVDSSDDTEFTLQYTDGVLQATATRAADTGNADDINLNDCAYVFLVRGTGFDGTSFSKHETGSPKISQDKVCFKQESIVQGPPGVASHVKAALSMIVVTLFIIFV